MTATELLLAIVEHHTNFYCGQKEPQDEEDRGDPAFGVIGPVFEGACICEHASTLLRATRPMILIGPDDELVCPMCGCASDQDDEAAFDYLEDETVCNSVEGLERAESDAGKSPTEKPYTLGVERAVADIDSSSDGSDGRLLCRNCMTEIDLPEGIEIDWR